MTKHGNSCSIELCERYLKETKATHIEKKIWPTLNRIVDRLLSRPHEMSSVYVEISQKLSTHQWQRVLELILDIAGFWNPAEAQKFRQAKSRLGDLNDEISETAEQLAKLLLERTEINEHSGYCSEYEGSIIKLIDEASYGNIDYESYVQETLKNLDCRFDDKYWPDISEIVIAIAEDAKISTVYAASELTEAAASSPKPSDRDFLRSFFVALERDKEDPHWGLNKDFILSNSSLATILNCALDVPPERTRDTDYVKNAMQRIRVENQVPVSEGENRQ